MQRLALLLSMCSTLACFVARYSASLCESAIDGLDLSTETRVCEFRSGFIVRQNRLIRLDM